jgi:hypothetical protein
VELVLRVLLMDLLHDLLPAPDLLAVAVLAKHTAVVVLVIKMGTEQ